MAGGASAKRYAQAILQIATEQNLLNQFRSDLDAMSAAFQIEALAAMLDSPRVPFPAKEELARSQFAGLHPLALNIALLLITKGRVDLAPAIAQEFNALADAAQGIAHAEVTTAVPMSDAEQTLTTERLSAMTGLRIILHAGVNPEIIGGLVAKIGDQLIDGSTRTRLAQLRRTLIAAGG